MVCRRKKIQVLHNGIYPSKKLWELYIYVVALLSRLYGEKYAQHFKEALVPFLYTIAKKISIFNWDAILSHTLTQEIIKAKYLNHNSPPKFYMAS